MSKIAIVGGGIVGSTCAFYLASSHHTVTLYDDGIGQATKAAAGIISPWLSQRRNKIWYRLCANGAQFYQKLMDDLKKLNIDTSFYRQNGTLVFKNNDFLLDKLETIARDRLLDDKMIGQLQHLSIFDISTIVHESTPLHNALFASGGAVIDGKRYTDALLQGANMFSFQKINKKVSLNDLENFDIIILAAGAWLPELLTPLGYTVDVRAQKGQLLEVQLPNKKTNHYPVFMLHGEIDLLPFENGKWVIGATHENDKGYDLTVDNHLILKMKHEASKWIPDIAHTSVLSSRVGIRAYTSDFTPFFGKVPHLPHVYVASGLGSSGLTSGPYIAYLISQMINNQAIDIDVLHYLPNKYIKKVD